MKVRIKRQDDRRSAPYWQVFHFRGEGRITDNVTVRYRLFASTILY